MLMQFFDRPLKPLASSKTNFLGIIACHYKTFRACGPNKWDTQRSKSMKAKGHGTAAGQRVCRQRAQRALEVRGWWMEDDGETCEPCYRRALAKRGCGGGPHKRQQIREKKLQKRLKSPENHGKRSEIGPKTLKKVQKRLVEC